MSRSSKARGRWWSWLGRATAFLVVAGGVVVFWFSKVGSGVEESREPLRLHVVDVGDVAVEVVESGVIEAESGSTVICEVEAILGPISSGGSGGMMMGMNVGSPGGRPGGRSGGMGGAARSGGGSNTSVNMASASGGSGSGGSGSGGSGGSGSGGSGSGGSGGSSGGAGSMGAAGGNAFMAGGGGRLGGMSGLGLTVPKPNIQSFNLKVQPHTAVPTVGMVSTVSLTASSEGAMGMGGGGGMFGSTERSGSTTILDIKPEGSFVRKGEVVCELDSAAFREELENQKIKVEEARSNYNQVRIALEVNELAMKEYLEGVLEQDRQAIETYIKQCRDLLFQAERNYQWSLGVVAKKLQPENQELADRLTLERCRINLREALGMRTQLEDFTAPRILKEYQAKSEAIKSDLLSKESVLRQEEQRLQRIEKAIANCVIVAPRDGILSYVNETNFWGSIDYRIEPGAIVRQGQPIFSVPDPSELILKVRINESKISRIVPGQTVSIRVDAVKDRIFNGRVLDVTLIPAPAQGSLSDVKVYNARVQIDAAADLKLLKPGLTAKAAFNVALRPGVVRVPVQAIHYLDNEPFVAVSATNNATQARATWRQVKIGLSNATYAEVIEGLRVGEEIVLNPESLPSLYPSTGTPLFRPRPNTSKDAELKSLAVRER